MASRLKNLTAAFSNVKIRAIMILTVIVLALVIVVGLIGLHRANQEGNASQLTKASNLQSIPGIQATSPQYAQTQQEVNQQNYQQAAATHGTNVPTIINQQGLGANNNPGAYNLGAGSNGAANGGGSGGTTTGAGTGSGAGTTTTETGANNSAIEKEKALEAQQKAQMDAMQKKLDELSSQQEQQQLQQTQSSMQKEAQQLLSSWNGSSDNPVQSYVPGQLATNKNKTTNEASGKGMENQLMPGNSSNSTNNTIIKSGDILFAVLDTAVDSDEPGPVMATIVSGQYQGAKLIGSIQGSPQIPGSNGPTKLILNFTTMSVPYLPESINVSAVAIDPDTARTALASDVDHHYVQRYGSLFASSFLEGYGQAVTQAGSTTTVSPLGGTTSTYASLTDGQQILAGLGQVGQSWGQQLGQTFNRQNTVTINSGVSVGILFLSDVSPDSSNTPTTTAPVTMNQAPVIAASPGGASVGGATGAAGAAAVAMPATVSTGYAPTPVPVPTQ